jgi:hypothetical protein
MGVAQRKVKRRIEKTDSQFGAFAIACGGDGYSNILVLIVLIIYKDNLIQWTLQELMLCLPLTY